jgi:hypothetical protein
MRPYLGPITLSDGRQGRLICDDVKDAWPLYALILDKNGKEYGMPFDEFGRQGTAGIHIKSCD